MRVCKGGRGANSSQLASGFCSAEQIHTRKQVFLKPFKEQRSKIRCVCGENITRVTLKQQNVGTRLGFKTPDISLLILIIIILCVCVCVYVCACVLFPFWFCLLSVWSLSWRTHHAPYGHLSIFKRPAQWGWFGLVGSAVVLLTHFVMLAHVPDPLIMAVKVGWKSHQSQR